MKSSKDSTRDLIGLKEVREHSFITTAGAEVVQLYVRSPEGSGDRVVYTQERPALLAKNRWNLPSEISVGGDRSWKPVHDALKAAIGDAYPYPF